MAHWKCRKKNKGKEETMGRYFTDNSAEVIGVMEEDFRYSHEVHGEKFYSGCVICKRLSGTEDRIPVIVSEKLIDVKVKWEGRRVLVSGDVRSTYKMTGSGIHLFFFIFAQNIECFTHTEPVPDDMNRVHLKGHMRKDAIYRRTPRNNDISDIELIVESGYGRTSCIHCIAWGRNALYAKRLKASDMITVDGRFQSRDFIKRYPDGTEEERTTYEVSVKDMRSEDIGGIL